MRRARSRRGRHGVGQWLVLVLYLLVPLPAQAFECPVRQALPGPAVLQETSKRTQELTTLLATGDLGNRVPIIVADLRKRYPNVADAEVSNYLIAAYCPVVAKLSGLGDAEKQARVDRFASEVRTAGYSQAGPSPLFSSRD